MEVWIFLALVAGFACWHCLRDWERVQSLLEGFDEEGRLMIDRAEVIADLRAILADLDEWGTPRVKLPNCPRCDADELGVLGEVVYCYGCGWELDGLQ